MVTLFDLGELYTRQVHQLRILPEDSEFWNITFDGAGRDDSELIVTGDNSVLEDTNPI